MEKQSFSNIILKIALLALALSTFLSEGTGVEPSKGKNCTFLNSSPGVCITIQDCLPLSAIWNEVTAKTTLFKSLICGEDGAHETLVCCPKSADTEERENSDGITESSNVENKIIFPDEEDLSDINIDQLHHVAHQSHKNFHLIPSLKECGERVTLFFDRIIGGGNADHGEYPWLAQIGYQDLTSDDLIFDCGGAVINKNYILTAAHCVTNQNFTPVIVRLGEHDMTTEKDCSDVLKCSTAMDFEIASITIHRNYGVNSTDRFDDIALIRVNSEIPFDTPFIKPVCLPFGQDYEIDGLLNEESITKESSIVAGWGRENWRTKNGSTVLKDVFLPIHSYESCKDEYESHSIRISPKQICVGGQIGEDSCGGDSGGPVMIPLRVRTRKNIFEPKIFQIGIVSYGPRQCGQFPIPSIATRVTAYLDWILNNVTI